MRQRKRTVSCPMCHKKLSPQGLNGHLRFVHSVGSAEASKAVAHAPRASEPEPVVAKLEARLQAIEEQVGGFIENFEHDVEERWSRSGMRRRLVALVAELADVRKQKSKKESDSWWWGSDEQNKQILESLDQVESEIRREIAELSAKLGEPES